MKRKIEVMAKKVDDAISEGLRILQLTLDEVDVKVLSAGGLFKKAKIEIYYGEDIPEKVVPAQTEKPEIKNTAIVSKQSAKDKVADTKPVVNKSADSGKPFAKPTAVEEKTVFERPKMQEEENIQWGAAPQFNKEPIMKAGEPSKVRGNNDNQNRNRNDNQNRGGNNNNRNNDRGENRNNNRNDNRDRFNDRDRQKPNGEAKVFKERESAVPTDLQREAAIAFLSELLKNMKVEASVEAVIDDGLRLNIVTEDAKIIGYRGEVLDCIQYFASLKVNSMSEKFVYVSLDGLDYRAKRQKKLEELAVKMGEKAVKSGKKVSLEPMNSIDRRIIHAALGESADVFTRSEGKEPYRRIAIIPKKRLNVQGENGANESVVAVQPQPVASVQPDNSEIEKTEDGENT